MTHLTLDNFYKEIFTPDFVAFMDAKVPKSSTLACDLRDRKLAYLEPMVVEAYHGLIFLFENYPDLKSVKPVWMPQMLSGRDFTVLFRLEMATEQEPKVNQYLNDEPPPSWEDRDGTAFCFAIDAGENIDMELWNQFNCLKIAKENTYTSIDEIKADMQFEVGACLADMQSWLLARATPGIKKSGVRPGVRL